MDYQHIIIDNLKRLPLAFIRTQCYDSREAMELADRIERTDNPYAKRQLMGELVACIEENQTLFNRIRNRIKGRHRAGGKASKLELQDRHPDVLSPGQHHVAAAAAVLK